MSRLRRIASRIDDGLDALRLGWHQSDGYFSVELPVEAEVAVDGTGANDGVVSRPVTVTLDQVPGSAQPPLDFEAEAMAVPAGTRFGVSEDPARKAEIQALVDAVAAEGVRACFGPHLLRAARHAAQAGWIDAAAVAEVGAAVARRIAR